MARRVLVTRPEPGASATAERLAAMGFEPVLLPLTRIEALHSDPLPDARDHDAVALTSANAVRCAPAGWLKTLAHLPCFTVGDMTAEAAREAGLNVVWVAAGDAHSLAEGMLARLKPGSRVLYPCGRTRTPTLEIDLGSAGIAVTPVGTYDAVAVPYDPEKILRRIGRAPLVAALVHSSRGGELLADIMSRPGLRAICKDMLVVGISAKAMTKIRDMRIAIADEPSEAALLDLVKAKV